ncbi:MAG: tetratricopeptide repeat protein [Rhodospirillaceae bacterium]
MLRSSVMALAMVGSIAAIEPLQKTFSSESDYTEKAFTALVNGQQTDAVAIYTKAIEQHPDSYMSHYRRGVTYARLGKHEQALADLNTAVRLSPVVKSSNELGFRAWNSLLPETHALNMVVLVRSQRADLLRTLKRPQEAIADLNVAISLDPRRTHLWHTRALLHMETGNATGAINDFSALLARRENAEWRFARGISYFVMRDYAKAEADFQTAATLDRKNALYARWLSKTQKARGIPV